MNFGVVMRTDVNLRSIAGLAYEAEAAGWDGFFICDACLGPNAWVLLATVAMRT